MSEQSKPTPGPWYADEPQPGDSYRYVDFGRGENHGYICRLSINGNVNTEANARLIAEAGTVHHETGLTPRQLAELNGDLVEALRAAQQCINSMKVEAETAAQGDEQMTLEACETISNEGLQADMDIRAALAKADAAMAAKGVGK